MALFVSFGFERHLKVLLSHSAAFIKIFLNSL